MQVTLNKISIVFLLCKNMWYQPIVDEHGLLVAAEALMRWSPASERPVPPAEFIPIAEESGIIHALGQWGLEAVCEQLSVWGPLVPDGFRVAVNLSAPEFLHPNFIERILDTMGITDALRAAGVQPGDTVYIGDMELEWED